MTCVDEESSLFQNPTAASGERPRCGAIAGEGLSRWTVSQRHNCWETPVPRAAQRSAAAQPPRPLRAPACAAAGARSRWRYGQPGRVGLRGEGTSPGTRVALEAPSLVCWSAETGCSTGGSGSASLAQSPPAVAAGEGAGCIAQHRRERSPRRSAQQTGSAEGWGRTSPRCKMLLAAASGPLRPSVSSMPSPTLRPGAAPPPRDTQRPVKELGALPNHQAANDATCSPYLTEAHPGRTSPTPLQKNSLGTFFQETMAVCTDQPAELQDATQNLRATSEHPYCSAIVSSFILRSAQQLPEPTMQTGALQHRRRKGQCAGPTEDRPASSAPAFYFSLCVTAQSCARRASSEAGLLSAATALHRVRSAGGISRYPCDTITAAAAGCYQPSRCKNG